MPTPMTQERLTEIMQSHGYSQSGMVRELCAEVVRSHLRIRETKKKAGDEAEAMQYELLGEDL